ncbi:28S ribosomal protein S18a, mitochondrial [Belonocnema kinseyi]|uniref:28S ribosomal protein S18a, mitochondrial n=1 Tax=Belonocnema kinseyi TaxID=2817044 RepID=UPI00143DD90B|nr:28S ribosomal protein S18a, mitochondrial [Belonocnema kinseyi]
MAAICRLVAVIGKNIAFGERRHLSLSLTRKLKEISEAKEGNVRIIEGKILPTDKENLFLKTKENGACPICSTGLVVKHTDVLILKQFLRSDGCMLPQRLTGLCRIQQKRIGKMVAMAQKAGLMPNLVPSNKKREPFERYKWKKFNTYYDEKTIRHRYNI